MSLPLDEWLAIAEGRSQMPSSFQRFIAAWELVVAWHRTTDPNQTTDAALKARLKEQLRAIRLDLDPDWHRTVAFGLPWKVFVMRGPVPTGNSVSVSRPEDIEGFVDAVYAVRCNLLKAGKSPVNENDLTLAFVAAEATAFIARRLHGH